MSSARKSVSLVTLIVISLLGCCMELDVSIPSFPSIMKFFHVTEAQVQNTLSINYFAFFVSGLLYGPLSEAWGRRSLMLVGAGLFLLGALGCVFSFSIYQLMFWRFVQGLGASSGLVLGLTMISDYYSGEIVVKQFSRINAYITVFMATAPIIGSTIINFLPWRANFTFVAVIAAASFLILSIWLPETKLDKHPLKIKTIFTDYLQIITHNKFMLYALLPNMLVTAYLTFVGSAAFYYINTCKLPVMLFAIHQGIIVGLFSMFSFCAGNIMVKIGAEKAVRFGMLLSGFGIALLTFCAYKFTTNPYLITFSMGFFAIGCAFPMSVTFAKSLNIIPSLKGTCSSFIMATRLLISSLTIACTGYFFDGTMRPVALVMSVCMVLSLLTYFLIQLLGNASASSDLAKASV